MREIRYICIYDESVLTIESVSVSISDNTAKLLIKDLQELLK